MSEQAAQVESIDALKAFRRALAKFAEEVSVALDEAESEISRTHVWLETEQVAHWTSEVRKREDLLLRAKEALRRKRLFPDSSGRLPSAVEEEKAVRKATAMLEEAHEKLRNTRKAIPLLEKEAQQYKGMVQRLHGAVQVEVPMAMAELDRMVQTLEQYVALRAPDEVGSEASAEVGGQGMVRGDVERTTHQAIAASARARAPSPAQRKAAQPAQVREPIAWRPVVDRPVLDGLDVGQFAIGPDDKIVVATDAWPAGAVLFERLEPAFNNDSGWVILPLDHDDDDDDDGGEPSDAPRELEVIRAADLMRACPSLEPVLALTFGALVTVDSNGETVVYDAQDQAVARMGLPPQDQE